jgi:predicted LPLAT superfamily acyltransferase
MAGRDRARRQRAAAGWEMVPERGAVLGMRFVAWFFRHFGKRATASLLVPIAAYFWATDRQGRRASNRYLERVLARAEGRRALQAPPCRRPSLTHYYQGALSVLDRAAFALGAGAHTEIRFEGRHHFTRLQEAKRGAILLGAHLGSFDALRVLANQGGLIVNMVMYHEHAPMIRAVLKQLDPVLDERLILLGPDVVRTALAIKTRLTRGEFVGILADRVAPGDASRVSTVNFLGAPARFPQGPFLLAHRLKCPVLFMVALRVGHSVYEAFAEPLWDGTRAEGDESDGPDHLLRAYVRRLETYCRRAPYQWFNFYDFWDDDAAATPKP